MSLFHVSQNGVNVTSFQAPSGVMWGLARKDLMILAVVAAATFLMVIVIILCIVRMIRRKRRSKMEHLNRYEVLVGASHL